MSGVPASSGGLGGLGGYIGSRGFGNLLQAAGMSMMGAPRNNPLQDFGKFYGGLLDQQRFETADARALEEKDQSYEARVAALIAAKVPEPEARTLARDPNAMTIRLNQLKADQAKAMSDQWLARVPDMGSSRAQSSPGSAVAYPGVDDAQIEDLDLENSSVSQDYGGVTPHADPFAAMPNVLATYPIPKGVVKGKSPAGLPATAERGATMPASDGKTYQYLQLSGGPDVDGDWGWNELLADGQNAQPGASGAGNKTVAWLKENDPEAHALIDQGFSPNDAFGVALARQQSRKPRQVQTQVAQAQAGSDQRTSLDKMYSQRDQLAAMLPTAPDEKALARGKAALDALDNKIEREQANLGRNKTYQYLSRSYPDIADMVKSGALSAKDGLSLAAERQKDNAGGMKAPTVHKLKMDDGSEMAVQWNSDTRAWDPINAPQGGGGIAPKTKLTENQSKLTLFQSLQTESQPVLLDLEKQFDPANIADAAARSTPVAGNFFQSEQGQIYQATATAWAEGALRIATGAAATPEEMERTKKAYFAQVGDTPITIAFKAQMREMYNRSIERALGKNVDGGLPKPSEFVKQFTGEAKRSQPGDAPRARNPQTGQTLEWDGSQWRPVQ